MNSPLRVLFCFSILILAVQHVGASESRPNILWLTSEDNGPHLGCYGDEAARTPHLDQLAQRGMLYWNAWSTAPVCAPARTAIISGMYPTSSGGHHMRSEVRLPDGFQMFPQFLREAGYYCSNNSKEDYNLIKPGQVWDDSSNQAHWRNRQPGQPFFAVFNFTTTHESQIRRRPHPAQLDPEKVRVPAYHPDTPEVRRDWAQYHDKIAEMDGQVGRALEELTEAGLAEDTIIFYYGDHGSGMPRSKRWLYNSGLRVPLIVHIPAKFRHLAPKEYSAGTKSERLVGFVDLAPTVLALAGIKAPEYFQGTAFLGPNSGTAPSFLFAVRDRMDERSDLIRAVRDERFLYIRNYMPHRIYGQYLDYMFQTPTTRIWKELYDAGKLRPPQTAFWETKPPEELYDLQTDPDEVNNLVLQPEFAVPLERLRDAHRKFLIASRDLGLVPEAEMHAQSERSPYEFAHDPEKFPVERIAKTADRASSLRPGELPALRDALDDANSAVRFWAVQGFLMRGEEAVQKNASLLRLRLKDAAPSVRIAAAEALGRHGPESDLPAVLQLLLGHASLAQNSLYTCVEALNALDHLGLKNQSVRPAIAELPRSDPSIPGKLSAYVPRLIETITAN